MKTPVFNAVLLSITHTFAEPEIYIQITQVVFNKLKDFKKKKRSRSTQYLYIYVYTFVTLYLLLCICKFN